MEKERSCIRTSEEALNLSSRAMLTLRLEKWVDRRTILCVGDMVVIGATTDELQTFECNRRNTVYRRARVDIDA